MRSHENFIDEGINGGVVVKKKKKKRRVSSSAAGGVTAAEVGMSLGTGWEGQGSMGL